MMNAIIDPDRRVSVFGGAFNGNFQIPNNPGQTPQLGLTVVLVKISATARRKSFAAARIAARTRRCQFRS